MKNKLSIIYIVFFLSGFTALVYQLVWIRIFGLVFGVSVFAVSTVLTAFMTGLALGNLLFGRLVDRLKHPLALFGFLQLGIGLFALIFPISFRLFESAYLSVHHLAPGSFYISSLIRFVFSFLFLLLPTTLMGGTLPVITRYVVKNFDHLGRSVGRLYSVNNLGAFLGCFVAGFLLVHVLGAKQTIVAASLVNLSLAAIVFLMNRRDPGLNRPSKITMPAEQSQNTTTYPAPVIKLVLWIFAIEGFTTLSYEVVWTRILLGISFDKSVYFSGTVILSFILGLSLGSWLITMVVDRHKNLLAVLGGIEISIGLLAIILLPVFAKAGTFLQSLRPFYVDSWITHLGQEYLLFFLIMLPPVILMGATFPIVSKIYTSHMQHLGSRIGFIGALDTVGSIFGSFIAGFIFIPFLGVVNAVFFTAVINLVIGLLLFFYHPHMRQTAKFSIGGAVVGCTVVLMVLVPKADYFRTWQIGQREDRLCYYKEGVAGAISVSQDMEGNRILSINGASSGGISQGDLEVHRLEGYLPYLFADQPQNALLIGMGTGVTANCLIQPDIRYLDCVEICPEVFDAAHTAMAGANNQVVSHAKFNQIIEDGRSYLLSTEQKYDIITSSGIHPRMSPNIYTTEFYQICRDHLTEGGAICKWIPTNWLSRREFQMLVKAFVDVFPHSSLWIGNASQAIIVGKKQPLILDPDVLSKKLQQAKIFQELSASRMGEPADLLSKFICGDRVLQRYVGDVAASSDNTASIEYSTTVNKGRNPQIIWELIDLKENLSAELAAAGKNLAWDELDRKTQAEKYFMIANIINVNGDREAEMLQALQHAIALDSTNYRYRESLATLLYKNGDRHKALQQMQQVLAFYPNYGPYHEKMGRIYFDLQEYDNAFTAFQNALADDPELAISRYYLALLYATENKLNRSIAELKKVIEQHPQFARAYVDLGIIYHSLNDRQQAEEYFRTSLDIQPDMEQAKIWLQRLRDQ